MRKQLTAIIQFDLANHYGIVELQCWTLKPGGNGSSGSETVTVRGDPGALHAGIRTAIIRFYGLMEDLGRTALGHGGGYSFELCGKEYTLLYTQCDSYSQIKVFIDSVIACCADAKRRLSTKGESSHDMP